MSYMALFTFDNRRDYELDICPVSDSYKTLEDLGMHILDVLQHVDAELGTDAFQKHGMRLYRWKLYKPYEIDLGDDKLTILILPTMGFMPFPLEN